MDEPIDTIVKFGLGILGGLAYPEIRERLKRRRESLANAEKSKQACDELSDLCREVAQAMRPTPHLVENRSRWAKRLHEFADANRALLGDLAYHVDRLSWRVRDNRFSHEDGKAEYCCNELLCDLEMLQVAALGRRARMGFVDRDELRREVRQHISKAYGALEEVGPFLTEDQDPGEELLKRSAPWFDAWVRGDLVAPEHLAMSSYINSKSERGSGA
jgi:hypothetical protein